MSKSRNHGPGDSFFKGMGFFINQIRFLSPKEAHQELLSGATLIDLREGYEVNYRIFDVPNIIYLSEEQVKKNPRKLPRSEPIIFTDNVGLISKEVVTFLVKKGFTNVSMIIGGVVDWVKQGLPVKLDRNYELTGQCGCRLRPKNPNK